MRAIPYFAFNLAPSLALFTALQVLFAGLLCAAQPIDYGSAFYNMMITSTTVGLGDVPIDPAGRHPWAKVVIIVHILLTVGTLSTIFAEAKELMLTRQKQIDRLLLMMRKNDPSLLLTLQESYAKACATAERERTSRKSHRRATKLWLKAAKAAMINEGEVRKSQNRVSRLSMIASSLYVATLGAAARDGAPLSEAVASAPSPSPPAEGLDKTEFVVAMLVQLGMLEWEEVLPVMHHFDILDTARSGRLGTADLVAEAQRDEQKLSAMQEKLRKIARTAGIAPVGASRAAAAQALQEGDYSAAHRQLEEGAMDKELSGDELRDAERVRSKVVDLISLAEMKWRYRVVEVGQSPRDEAIKILSHAMELIEKHLHVMSAGAGLSSSGGGDASEGKRTLRFSEADADSRSAWAQEKSAILQGLGVTRLIFNATRDEDEEIERLLSGALHLRELLDRPEEIAETLNSLGALKQKQKAYADAHDLFQRSLELRMALYEGNGGEHGSSEGGAAATKDQKQNEAQSLVSLGNLAIERADATEGGGAGGGDAASQYYAEAIRHLRAAKEAYIAGFHETHPKVAWAMEGLGRIYEKQDNLGAALEEYNKASYIRRMLQSKSGNMQMFTKELNHNESRVSSIAARLQSRTVRFSGAVASSAQTQHANLSA